MLTREFDASIYNRKFVNSFVYWKDEGWLYCVDVYVDNNGELGLVCTKDGSQTLIKTDPEYYQLKSGYYQCSDYVMLLKRLIIKQYKVGITSHSTYHSLLLTKGGSLKGIDLTSDRLNSITLIEKETRIHDSIILNPLYRVTKDSLYSLDRKIATYKNGIYTSIVEVPRSIKTRFLDVV